MDIYSTSFCLPQSILSATSSRLPPPPASPTRITPSPLNSNANRTKHSKADSIDSRSFTSLRAGGPKRHSTSSLATELSGNGSAMGTHGTGRQNGGLAHSAMDEMKFELNEAMERLCVTGMANTHCVATSAPIDTAGGERGYSVHLTGGYPQVMSARGTILRESPFTVRPFLLVLP